MKLSKTRSNHRGFTLIELMIVIMIMGILAAAAIPNYIAYRRRNMNRVEAATTTITTTNKNAGVEQHLRNALSTILMLCADGYCPKSLDAVYEAGLARIKKIDLTEVGNWSARSGWVSSEEIKIKAQVKGNNIYHIINAKGEIFEFSRG